MRGSRRTRGGLGMLLGAIAAVAFGALAFAQSNDDGEVQVGSVSIELLNASGFDVKQPSLDAAAGTVGEDLAIAAVAREWPENKVVDSELVVWRNLNGEGPVPDGTVVWIVQSDPPGYYVHDRSQDEYSEKFHIDLVDARTGEWIIGFERLR
ncbi:MAG: hypothetical protein ACSLFM_13110 [Tepidiformaceae bacterium]